MTSLLQLIRRTTRHRTDAENDGFSLPLVIAAAFMLIIGGMALANRANQGLLGAVFQNQSWEAREAAEIGMNRIISELNQERNRWLMVKREGDVDEGIWQNRSDASQIVQLRINPCNPTVYPRYSKLDPSNAESTTYGTWYINANGSVTNSATGASRAYRLVSVTRQPFTRSWNGSIIQALNPFRDREDSGTIAKGVGAVVIAVQGQALRDGNPIASVTLEKELELVPKCCNVSFGGQHGSVDYGIDESSGTSACISAAQLGLGLLGGAGQSNTGAITLRGAATDIETSNGIPVDPIYCIAETSAGCAIRVSGSDINVAIIDSELPPAKTYPGSGSPGTFNFSGTNSNNFLYTLSVTSGSGKSKKDYSIVNGSYTNTASLPSYCTATIDTIHCNLSSFNYSGEDVIFVTGNKRIFLYFPNPGTIIRNTGNGTMAHCLSLDTSNGSCTSTPGGAEITRLSMFGCNPSSTCTSQDIALKGTVDALRMFTYFPAGNVTLAGDSSYEGINWSNEITSNGNPTWIVPGSGLASVFALMDMLPSSGDSSSNSLIAYDFVARSTNRHRWIGWP
jgi:hypothetical protein